MFKNIGLYYGTWLPWSIALTPDLCPDYRSVVMYVLENPLWLIMSQAVRLLREPNFAPRDKQLLKRELSAELVCTIILGLVT